MAEPEGRRQRDGGRLIVACIVVGIFLYVNDMVWKYVVQHVLLK